MNIHQRFFTSLLIVFSQTFTAQVIDHVAQFEKDISSISSVELNMLQACILFQKRLVVEYSPAIIRSIDSFQPLKPNL
ncbi:MAG: hypothetical protein SH856_08105 [Flavobacteriales bacterium]|nr:hypothetical protein [Flavobacteriales bacterium]